MNKPLSRLPRIPDWPGDPDIACDISPDDHEDNHDEHNVVGQKPEFDPTWVCGVCGVRHGPDECKGVSRMCQLINAGICQSSPSRKRGIQGRRLRVPTYANALDHAHIMHASPLI